MTSSCRSFCVHTADMRIHGIIMIILLILVWHIHLCTLYVSKIQSYNFIYSLKRSAFCFFLCRTYTHLVFFFLVFLWFSKKRRGIVFQVCNHSVEMFKIEFRSCARAQIYTAVAANHWLTIISCFPLVFVCPLVRASVTACYLQDKGHCLLVYRGKNVTYIHISHR